MKTRLTPPSERAFTLVELSIVLVILGLLIGGVLGGQSLIRAAELRSITTEYQNFTIATTAFKSKYLSVPGDMPNATSFWGYSGGTGCTNRTGAATVSTGTCDGDGDTVVYGAAGATQSGESFQFWRQLALASLIEGAYSGFSGSGSYNHSTIGANVPSSKLPGAAWYASYGFNHPGDANAYALDYGNFLLIGASTTNSAPAAALLKPEEAWNIDTKLDDGKPARGRVIARFWNNLCAAADDGSSANNDLAASYRLTDSTKQCALYFIRQH